MLLFFLLYYILKLKVNSEQKFFKEKYTMYSKFKKKDKVIVYGLGENEGKFYKNVPGIVVERDPYFKDFHIRFKDGTDDWFAEESLKKPY